ncbi:MAG: hypothetical protein QOD77_473 [Thermoplasmata archaeon]|jgi:hypothetical protein|nr:hypothetical protein [Thermoplasmata archaeon]
MARSIMTMTLLAALVALPVASASAASSSLSLAGLDTGALLGAVGDVAPTGGAAGTVLDAAADAPATAVAAANGAADTGIATVADAGAAVRRLLCRDAVEVDFTWYGARVTDQRDLSGDFLVPYTIVDRVTRIVPVYETVTEVVGGTATSLFGLLEPVTREVTRIVGYELKETVREHTVDLAVTLAWRESYLEWGTYRDTLYLGVVPGLPYLDSGAGALVKVCDDQTPILDFVPDPQADGVVVWCALCTEQPADGWTTDLLSMGVQLAAPGQQGVRLNGGWLIGLPGLDALVQKKADALGLTAADVPGAAGDDAAPADAETPPIGTASAGAVQVPATTLGVVAALAAAGLAGVAFAGRAVVRRFR